MTNANSTPDFPVPSDLPGFWQWDKLHFPKPQTTLTRDSVNPAVTSGFSGAMDELSCPVGVEYKNINTYAYISVIPFELTNETIEERVAKYKENIGTFLPNMDKSWEGEWLPSIIPAVDSAMIRDYSSLTDQQLVETFERHHQFLSDRHLRWMQSKPGK